MVTGIDLRVAIVVDPELPPGLLANTVATLAIGIGAVRQELGGTELRDREGRTIHCSANRPVPVLQAPSEVLRELLVRRALPAPPEAVVVAFPRFARSLHRFEDYAVRLPEEDLSDAVIDGVGLAGPDRWIRSLTGSLKLLR